MSADEFDEFPGTSFGLDDAIAFFSAYAPCVELQRLPKKLRELFVESDPAQAAPRYYICWRRWPSHFEINVRSGEWTETHTASIVFLHGKRHLGLLTNRGDSDGIWGAQLVPLSRVTKLSYVTFFTSEE